MYYVRKEHIHGPAEDSADLAYDEAEFESYVRWVKTQEGLPSGGHVPHIYIDSAGVPTIGYGHTDADTINKLQFQGESLEGISEQEADRLLRLDLSKNFDTLRQRMANIGRLQDFDTLDPNAKFMMLDYEFNLGDINKYSRMRTAILDRDWDTVLYEFERFYEDAATGEMKPIKWRNQSTFNYFLNHRFQGGESLTEEEHWQNEKEYWQTQESVEK